MRWAEGFIAVDWGTTNRRAWRIAPDGAVAAELADDRGILAVAEGGFPAAVEELRTRLGDLPLLMAGMILYQTSELIHGGETNYIMATVGLYVSIYNLFTSLLHLLGAFGGDDS